MFCLRHATGDTAFGYTSELFRANSLGEILRIGEIGFLDGRASAINTKKQNLR